MVNATLSRGGTSVALPLLGEGAGEPVVSTTLGKPESGAASKGALNPRWSDMWSQTRTYTLAARFTATDAYSTVITLADLIKSYSGGTDLILNIGLDEFDTDMAVAPAPGQGEALSLAYAPGQTDWVDVQLSLTRINDTLGSGDQSASTPTATGTGPITLSDGTTTVELSTDVVVDRAVGRPNSVVRRSTQTFPNYIDHRKAAADRFDIGVQFTTNAATTASDLMDMVGQKLGRSALTLDFQGLYGLGSFNVVPEGSDGLRLVRPAAEQGTVIIPSISLRVVAV